MIWPFKKSKVQQPQPEWWEQFVGMTLREATIKWSDPPRIRRLHGGWIAESRAASGEVKKSPIAAYESWLLRAARIFDLSFFIASHPF